jgi:hypothetical protein
MATQWDKIDQFGAEQQFLTLNLRAHPFLELVNKPRVTVLSARLITASKYDIEKTSFLWCNASVLRPNAPLVFVRLT